MEKNNTSSIPLTESTELTWGSPAPNTICKSRVASLENEKLHTTPYIKSPMFPQPSLLPSPRFHSNPVSPCATNLRYVSMDSGSYTSFTSTPRYSSLQTSQPYCRFNTPAASPSSWKSHGNYQVSTPRCSPYSSPNRHCNFSHTPRNNYSNRCSSSLSGNNGHISKFYNHSFVEDPWKDLTPVPVQST